MSVITDCSICMDALCTEHITLTECGHFFHTNCLSKWNALNTSCPLCRFAFVVDDRRNEWPFIDSRQYIGTNWDYFNSFVPDVVPESN
jgi:hypothetical protein